MHHRDYPDKSSSLFPFLFIAASLRYNSQAITFIHTKCSVLFRVGQPSSQPIDENFHQPIKKPHQFNSVTQSCPTLCHPMNCSTPGLLVHHQLPEFTQLMSIESVMPSNHLILCHPLLLPPSIFPSIRVFSTVSSSHQVAKVLEFQFQHQSFQ